MMPTRLALWLFALGLIPLGAGLGYAIVDGMSPAVSDVLALLVLAWDIAIFLLFLLDAVLAARYSRLRARRELPTSFWVGVPNEIVIVRKNAGRRRVEVMIRDTPPPAFPAEPPLLTATVAAHAWVRAPYRLVA